MKSKRREVQAQDVMKVLFLESHGLRSPLTAIRWACGRLRRGAGGSLTKEQMHLVDHVYDNTKVLTTALESMLLITKMEERSFALHMQDVCITDLLHSARESIGMPSHLKLHVHAPRIYLHGDRHLLELIFRVILSIFLEQPRGTELKIFIEGSMQQRTMVWTFRSSFLLPVLAARGEGDSSGPQQRAVGGIPGLMLSLAHELAKAVRGTVELEEVITGEFVTDGTVEVGRDAADMHRIVFSMPTVASFVEEGCRT